jgi:hypothetical protein
MSRDTVNSKINPKRDTEWEALIERSEAEISACRERLRKLHKSLRFFKKQASSGTPFPLSGEDRHQKIS